MTRQTKGSLLKYAGLGLDVGAPLVATLTQFPIMIERSAEATVSGLFVMLALLSAIPIIKYFGSKLKTPSVTIMWAIFLAATLALRAIIDEMVIVAAVGAASNALGGVLYKLGEGMTEDKKEE